MATSAQHSPESPAIGFITAILGSLFILVWLLCITGGPAPLKYGDVNRALSEDFTRQYLGQLQALGLTQMTLNYHVDSLFGGFNATAHGREFNLRGWDRYLGEDFSFKLDVETDSQGSRIVVRENSNHHYVSYAAAKDDIEYHLQRAMAAVQERNATATTWGEAP